MNQCTDQLILALLPPERIASVTWLARDSNESLMAEAAQRVATNHGLSEEVVQQKPDLVVAGSFTTPATRGLLKQLGYPLLEVDHADSFDDIRLITRQIAEAVGEKAKGELLIAQMDQQLGQLAQEPSPPLRVAAWDDAGFSARKGSLYDNILQAAGAINVAHDLSRGDYNKPDIEVLLLSAPNLLVKGAQADSQPQSGLRENVERHPLVRQFWNGARTLTIRQAYYVCGTPMVAHAVKALHQDLRNAAKLSVDTPMPFAQKGTL